MYSLPFASKPNYKKIIYHLSKSASTHKISFNFVFCSGVK